MTIKRGLLTLLVLYVSQLEENSNSESCESCHVFKLVLCETFVLRNKQTGPTFGPNLASTIIRSSGQWQEEPKSVPFLNFTLKHKKVTFSHHY